MNRNRLFILALGVLFVVALAVANATAAQAGPNRSDRPHTACKFEDSRWCVWHAPTRGNGEGRSFWSGRQGRPHYVSHATARRLLATR